MRAAAAVRDTASDSGSGAGSGVGSSSDSGSGYGSGSGSGSSWSSSSTASGGSTGTSSYADAGGGTTTTTWTDSWTWTTSSTSSYDGSWSWYSSYTDTWDVSTTSTDAGGLTQHDWGTWGDTTTSNGEVGFYSTQTVSTDSANETGSQTIVDASGGVTSWTWNSNQQDTQTTGNSYEGNTGTSTSSDAGSGSSSDGSNYTGTLVQPISGGAVSGTDSGGGSDSSSYQFSTNQTYGPNGASTNSGTSSETGSSSTQDGFSGSGSYVVGADGTASDGTTYTGNGTITFSGSDGATDTNNGSFTLGSDGSWQQVGGGVSSTGNSATHYTSSYTGTYVQPIDGGAINGSNTSTSTADSSNQFVASQSVDANGNSTYGGTLGQTAYSSTQDGYGGSGSYVGGADSVARAATASRQRAAGLLRLRVPTVQRPTTVAISRLGAMVPGRRPMAAVGLSATVSTSRLSSAQAVMAVRLMGAKHREPGMRTATPDRTTRCRLSPPSIPTAHGPRPAVRTLEAMARAYPLTLGPARTLL